MAVVGFNFTKVNAEVNQKSGNAKINIKNNITIKEIDVSESSFASKEQKMIRFVFEFKSEYKPDLGNIKLEGEVLMLEQQSKVDDIEKAWKKDRSVPKEIMQQVLSTALNKCNIQALILSQQINLPAPIPLPKVEAADPKASTSQDTQKKD